MICFSVLRLAAAPGVSSMLNLTSFSWHDIERFDTSFPGLSVIFKKCGRWTDSLSSLFSSIRCPVMHLHARTDRFDIGRLKPNFSHGLLLGVRIFHFDFSL